MSVSASNRQDRVISAAAALLLQAGLGYLLVTALDIDVPAMVDQARMTVFDLPPQDAPPPLQVKPPPKQKSPRPSEGAPPNIKSQAAEIVVPDIQTIAPPPTVTSTVKTPSIGVDATSGLAPNPGPGTGRGGVGNGTGNGSGRGAGRGDGDTPPERLSGQIRDSDYPKDLAEQGIGGTVSVKYRVETTGRVSHCTITQSSGNAALDAATCTMIEKRFRFRPARDETGAPVSSSIVEDQSWIIRDTTPEPR